MKRRFTILTAAFMLLAFLALPMGMMGQTTVASYSRSGTTNTITGGNFSTTFSAKSGYYQDANGDCYMQILNTDAYWTSVPTSISFDATIGGGTGNHDLTNPVYVSLLDENGDVINATQTAVTSSITTNTGDDYSISIPVVNNVFGVKLSHEKESGYNVRYYSFSLSFSDGGTPTPTTYTVTFDAGDGTFVGNNDFPNASNTVEAGTYTLPSATREGYTFEHWNIGEYTYDAGDSYTVSANADFVASYTENTPPTPGGDLVIDFESAANTYTDWTFTNMTSQQTGSITAHGGTNYGTTGGKTTASITTNTTIATPGILTCYVSKQSTNTSASTWYIQVSSDGTTWTDVESRSAVDMNKGEWKEFTADLSSYTNVYVRVYYSGSTAVRNIDDLTLTTTVSSVATPTFNPADGTTFGNEGLTVTIACETPNTAIYYTVDGSTPDNNSTLYENAIILTTTATIKAVAYDGTNYSNVATATYTYIDPNAPGTQNNPYTVAQARAAIDANTGTQGVYATGIVSEIVTAYGYNGYSNITFNFVDNAGDTDFLQAFRCVSTNDADASTVAVGDVVVVYGNLKKYNSIYEFDAACQLVSIEHPAVAVEAPVFGLAEGGYAEAQTVTLTCATEGATIYYTIDGTTPDNTSTEYTEGIMVSETTIIKAIAYNNGSNSTVSTATYYILSNDNVLTVTEALEFSSYPVNNIFVQGIVSTAPTAAPNNSGQLTYYISVDGEATDQLEVYRGKNLNNTAFAAQDDIQLGDIVTIFGNVKIYNGQTEFDQGNYLVAFERPEAPVVPSITVDPALVEVDANEHDGTLSLTYENLEISDMTDFDIQYYDAEGEEATTPDWIEVLVAEQDPAEGEGYVVSYYMMENEGEARTAYFKVFALGDEDFVYSNLVTVSQAAPVVPPTPGNWVLTSLADLTENDVFVIVGTYDDVEHDSYAMSNDNGTSAPAAVEVTVAENTLSGEIATNIQWNLSGDATNGYIFYPNGTTETWLYCTNTNNGVKVGINESNTFTMDAETGYLKHVGTSRYIGIYNTQDWRCYTNTTGNIAGQTFAFYKKVEGQSETHTLTINGYNDDNAKTGYYLIASPVTVTIADVEGMTEGDFDLYYYDDAQELEWINYEYSSNNFTQLVPGMGYLYAKKATTETPTYNFNLTGIPYVGDGEIEIGSGWTLVGNPFGKEAEISADYYALTQDSEELIPTTAETHVAAMQGVFVYSEEASSVIFEPVETGTNTGDGKLVLNVTRNRGNVIDRAIIRFGEGNQLPKFQLFENSSKIYFTESNQDYAIVRSANEGEMPVSFKAKNNGTYTLNVNAENVEMEYLHLIDNMTGADIDLLATPSYSFEANTTDYATRFRLVFSANNENASTSSETFAFFNGSSWTISNLGEATLQVVDVMGRIVSSQTISGNAEVNVNEASGVYMFRLINGNDVKTQKVVVR